MKFIDLVQMDLKVARRYVEGKDETDINIAAYHTHQFVEKLCALIAQVNGIKTIKSHRLDEWVQHLQDNNIVVPDCIEADKFTIANWASSPRYDINFTVSRERINRVLDCAEKWMETIEAPLQKRQIFTS